MKEKYFNVNKLKFENNCSINARLIESGISIVALIIVVIILSILSFITIQSLSKDNFLNHIYSSSQIFKEKEKEENQIFEKYANDIDDSDNERIFISEVVSTNHDDIFAKDMLGNFITVPGGFKIAEDSSYYVEDGVVIEDNDKNQFVWIPVSNTSNNGTDKIKTRKKGEIEIVLGRYSFENSEKNYNLVQIADNYLDETIINGNSELLISRKVDENDETKNATAKNLKKFIESVKENHGYYIGRYEASYKSGETFSIGTDSKYYKPASIKSTGCDSTDMKYISGNLWNYITQGEASIVSQNMYYDNLYSESDLMNSYSYDTALTFIVLTNDSDYLFKTDGNDTLHNSGDQSVNDKINNIFDLSGNLREWTTEYGNGKDSYGFYPCTDRGGSCKHLNKMTCSRTNAAPINNKNYFIGFRILLYLK